MESSESRVIEIFEQSAALKNDCRAVLAPFIASAAGLMIEKAVLTSIRLGGKALYGRSKAFSYEVVRSFLSAQSLLFLPRIAWDAHALEYPSCAI